MEHPRYFAGGAKRGGGAKGHRKDAGWTRKEQGVWTGIETENASAKMNQYEQGVHVPKYPRLKGLAKALKVPPAYFYAETDDLADLLYAWERLSGRKRQELIRLAQG